jgi:hypothetical protein
VIQNSKKAEVPQRWITTNATSYVVLTLTMTGQQNWPWCDVCITCKLKEKYLFLNFQKSIYSSMQLAWILHNQYNHTTTTNLPSLSWVIILCCQPNQTSTIFTELLD